MRCTSASSRPTPSRNAFGVDHHVDRSCRRACAPRSPWCSPSASGRSSGGCACGLLRSACPRGRGAAARARCACSPRTRRARCRRDRLPATSPSSTSFGSGRKYSADEIGAPFFERRELLLEQRSAGCPCSCSAIRPDAWPITSCMSVVSSPATLLHFSRALGFLRRPRELAAELGRRRLVVGLVDVRQRHRLAAVLLADRLIVRQVDADRRDRARVAGLDDDVDGVGGDALDARLAVLRDPTACGPRTTARWRRASGCAAVFSWLT